MDKSIYYIWLSRAIGLDSPAYATLFSHFETAKDIYDAEDYDISEKLTESQKKKLLDKSIEKDMDVYSECRKKNIGILTYEDDLYPQRFRIIASPPPVLYYKGNLKNLSEECLVSIVGTREMSDYGREITYKFSNSLALSGAVIVSGMASGVDSVAHRGALDAGGFTVAILGTAIDKAYPRENTLLYDEISEKGLILSESAPGASTHGFNFPIRNRLISAISSATLVTEAGEKSGALITARLAVMQGKDVYAVPGVTGRSNSAGTNMLLQRGVNLAYRPSDILSPLELVFPGKIKIKDTDYKTLTADATPFEKNERRNKSTAEVSAKIPSQSKMLESPSVKLNQSIGTLEKTEQMIVDVLKKGGAFPDDIVSKTGLDAGEVLSSLTVLELYGVVKEETNGKYSLS